MKNLLGIICFCVLVLLGLAACDKNEDVPPLRVAANSVLQEDFIFAELSTTVRLNVLDNDDVPAGGTLTFSNPRYGFITSDSAGFVYQAPTTFPPALPYPNIVRVSYKYCTATSCDSSFVNLMLGDGCNLVPSDDYAATMVNQPVDIPILANDDLCTPFSIYIDPVNSGVVLLPGNIVRYTPKANFTGIDTFSYYFSGNHYKRATVWVNVGETSCTIKANDDIRTIYQTTGQPPVPQHFPPLRNDWVCKNVTLEIISLPAHGTVGKDPERQHFLYYTPAAGYIGPDFFQYKICTATGECDVATVNLNVGLY